jgi:hypothetical protein
MACGLGGTPAGGVETDVFDVAGLIQTDESLAEDFDLLA